MIVSVEFFKNLKKSKVNVQGFVIDVFMELSDNLC